MASVNKRRNCPIVIINDLDSTIINMTFDYFVLNRYGNYDKTIPYNYLHADVIDIHDVCTVNVIIGSSFINLHKYEFTKRNHLRIEDFTI
jgi:hypothetical protein